MLATRLEFLSFESFLRIEPLTLIDPNSSTERDRNVIRTSIEIKADVFRGQFVAYIMTTDFELLKQDLKKLYNNLHGKVEFRPLERELAFSIYGDGLGHFQLDGEASPQPPDGPVLTFSLTFDQTQITEYVAQLNTITKQFPIDGDFKIKNEF
jgi:hypothetical protein